MATAEDRIRHFVGVAGTLLEACAFYSERAGERYRQVAELAEEFRRQMPYDAVHPRARDAGPPETTDGCCPLCRKRYDGGG